MILAKKLDSKDEFLSILSSFKKDKDFCIEKSIREIYSKYSSETLFVLLGRSFYSWQFILASKEKFKNILIVDDYHYSSGKQMLGIELISSDKLIEISKNNNLIAINCCPNGHAKLFFNRLCSLHQIPLINNDQASRLLDINDGLDYRAEDWGPYILENESKIIELADTFSDSQSAQSMFDVLSYQLSCDTKYIQRAARLESSLYFYTDFFDFTKNEKFLDCGAADGDTAKTFMDVAKYEFDRLWMVEPAPVHREALEDLMRSMSGKKFEGKLSHHSCGVGDKEYSASFYQDGNGSRVSENENSMKIDIKRIDDFLDDSPTFIKMDIEGFELSALKGAESSIRNGKPKMAISAYHRASDFVDISSYVLSIDPNYKIGLRHHCKDRWETCLYFYK